MEQKEVLKVATASLKRGLNDIDPNLVKREAAIKQTPSIKKGDWKIIGDIPGQRGTCRFYPRDPEQIKLFKEYNTEYVQYNWRGEPNFKEFAEVSVKISDMNTNRQGHNYKLANKKALNTEWAKKNALKTTNDIEEYIKVNGLTWHENQNGVGMDLIPTEINGSFGHAGGVSAYKHYDSNARGIAKVGQEIGKAKVNINRSVVKLEETFTQGLHTVNEKIDLYATKYISEEFSRINREGLNVGFEAAMFTATLSTVSNLYEVAKGEKEIDEAVYDVLSESVKSGCVGYASGALMEVTSMSYGQASVVVNATIKISKQLYAYVDGQIDEKQLVSNIAMESVHLAGSYIGGVIGQTLIPIPIVGHMVGAVVGEIVTSLVCSEVVRIHELEKYNKKLIDLYKNAEREIKESQSRLKELIDAENDELIKTVEDGFESLMVGIKNGNYDDIVKGIVTIGSKFGLTEQELKQDLVTRNTLFAMSDDILVIE